MKEFVAQLKKIGPTDVFNITDSRALASYAGMDCTACSACDCACSDCADGDCSNCN